jgi:hypothetical protein
LFGPRFADNVAQAPRKGTRREKDLMKANLSGVVLAAALGIVVAAAFARAPAMTQQQRPLA